MRIIVTGGAGFIGSHVADAYIKAGHKVAIIDNLSTGLRKNVNPGAKFYKADVRNQVVMKKIFRRERPGVVSHHAAIIDVIKSTADPAGALETNTLGTLNLILAFCKYGQGRKKFIFASSAGVYGKQQSLPATEKAEKNPPSPYGLSKFLSEEIIKFYSQQFDFQYLIFRYANVYGQRQRGGVVSIFSSAMQKNKIPVIFGDGTKTRDYIYVEDVVRANLFGLRRGKNKIVNISSGKETSDQKIYDTIAKILGFSQKSRYAPFREGEIYRSALSPRLAKKIIGWQSQTNLEEGIGNTLANFNLTSS